MLLLIILGAIFIALFWYVAIRPMNYWKKRGVQQEKPTWFFGNSLGLILRRENPVELVTRIHKRFSAHRYSGMYQLTKPALFIHDPDLIKQIAVKDFDHFTDHRSFMPENVDPLFGKSLFTLKGQKWRDMRPVVSPVFTSSKMKAMFVLIKESVEEFVGHFVEKKEDVIEVELTDSFTRFGNDVIASVAFGFKIDSFANPDNEFYLTGKEVTSFTGIVKALKFFTFVVAPKLSEILRLRLFSEKIGNYFIDLINEAIKTREETCIVRPDLIHIMMEARKGNNKNEENGLIDTGFATAQESDIKKDSTTKFVEITNLDIASQAFIFFFAGFNSVTTLMCFMAYELAINTDIQDRLREEIEETKAQCAGKLTYEALLKMKYMDMVVSETLRKWPNQIATDRVCTKPYTIEPKYPDEKPVLIETGINIILPMFGLHHDPQYFPDPDKFDPERFSDENKGNIKSCSYIPFGVGPRNCIGSRLALLEIKTLFFYLLSTFEIVPVKKTQIPIRLSRKALDMSIDGGLNLGLKHLNKI